MLAHRNPLFLRSILIAIASARHTHRFANAEAGFGNQSNCRSVQPILTQRVEAQTLKTPFAIRAKRLAASGLSGPECDLVLQVMAD